MTTQVSVLYQNLMALRDYTEVEYIEIKRFTILNMTFTVNVDNRYDS
jgi:hypothetical protein